MAPNLEISIPTTTLSPSTATTKPHTVYHIALRHPVRSLTLQKRYSDFTALHAALTAQSASHTAPPFALPQKSWFKSTVSSPALTEERRRGLESYLRAINAAADPQWRACAAWRAFLGITGAGLVGEGVEAAKGGFAAASANRRLDAAGSAPVTDQVVWLDVHRDLKAQLRDVRAILARRDAETTAQGQHEAGVEAKSRLVRSGVMLGALERGLLAMSHGEGDDGSRLSADEVRRRKDLLAAAKKERDGLETLLSSVTVRSTGGSAGRGTDSGMATAADKNGLLSEASRPAATSNVSKSGRVLGGPAKETERTRELDNAGVLQLQKQIIAEQDSDVLDLTKAVRRMKEMGLQINDELAAQDELLRIMDQDVDRVAGKIAVAKKKVGNIK